MQMASDTKEKRGATTRVTGSGLSMSPVPDALPKGLILNFLPVLNKKFHVSGKLEAQQRANVDKALTF
jgi:hypothetical protein